MLRIVLDIQVLILNRILLYFSDQVTITYIATTTISLHFDRLNQQITILVIIQIIMIPTTPTIITDTTMIQIITVQTTEVHPGVMAIAMEEVR